MKNLSRNRRKQRKMSKKNYVNKKRNLIIGGGETPKTTIRIEFYPLPSEDNLFAGISIACMKIDFGVNIHEIILDGGAQVCNLHNSREQATQIYNRIITNKFGVPNSKMLFIQNHLSRFFSNVPTNDQGLGIPTLGADNVNIIAHASETLNGFYINFIAYRSGATVGVQRLEQLHHLSVHKSDRNTLNDRPSVSHLVAPGIIKSILWKLCAQCDCETLARLPVNSRDQIYQLTGYNPPPQIDFYMNTEISDLNGVPLFWRNMIIQLRNYLIDININTPQFINLDTVVKSHIAHRIENTCSDVNDDRVVRGSDTSAQTNAKGKYYSDRSRDEKFSTYPHENESRTKRNLNHGEFENYKVYGMPNLPYIRQSHTPTNPGNANNSTNI